MRRGKERGFVLMVVLWVLAMLTIVTVGFGRRALIDQQVAAYSLDHAQATLMARAAVQRGVIALRNKAVVDLAQAQAAFLGGGRHKPPVTHLGQPWARPVNILESEDIFEAEDLGPGDTCTYHIRDELSRISINSASFDLLENIKALDRGVMRQIRQRRTGRLQEREDEGVLHFHAIEELRYIRGVDEEAWYGDGEEPGLRDLLTVAGGARINLNTASRAVLEAIPDVDEQTVNRILAYRAGPDGEIGTGDDLGFWDDAHLQEMTGINNRQLAALRRYGVFNSNMFTITGIATQRNGRVRAAVTATVAVSDRGAQVRDWREEPIGS